MALKHGSMTHLIKHNLNLNTFICIFMAVSIEYGLKKIDKGFETLEMIKEQHSELINRINRIETFVGLDTMRWKTYSDKK